MLGLAETASPIRGTCREDPYQISSEEFSSEELVRAGVEQRHASWLRKTWMEVRER